MEVLFDLIKKTTEFFLLPYAPYLNNDTVIDFPFFLPKPLDVKVYLVIR